MARTHSHTALITGSTSGIGLATARALAAAGCDVVVTGFGAAEQIDSLTRELSSQYGVRALYLAADLREPAEVRALVASATEHLQGVQILVNNAGIQHVAPLEEFPEDKWNDIIAVNLSAAFHATQAVLPSMKQRGWGRVINIASAHGLVASANKSAYVASKHGLIGLTKVTALETARFGITANAICPGWVRTPLVDAQVQDRATRSGQPLSQAEIDLLSEKQPMPIFTTPEQIAGMVVYLCSEAAATITGAALSIDGGWVAQ